jgi:hypothetical protein
MNEYKEVSVALTPADEEALSRPLTRRRRTRKSAIGGSEGGVPLGGQIDLPTPEPSTMVVKDSAVVAAPQVVPQTPVLPTSAPPSVVSDPKPTLAPMPAEKAPVVPIPAPSATVGGAVKIHTRKRTHGHRGGIATNATRKNTVIAGGTKILSTKRHALPTIKPKLVVPLTGGSGTTATAAANTAAKPVLPTAAPVLSQAGGKGRRRFTERRLSISMKQDKSTRKAGRKVRRQVRRMTVEEIRKVLLEKKILKPKSNPPEAMLRSMMRDYLTLKH